MFSIEIFILNANSLNIFYFITHNSFNNIYECNFTIFLCRALYLAPYQLYFVIQLH